MATYQMKPTMPGEKISPTLYERFDHDSEDDTMQGLTEVREVGSGEVAAILPKAAFDQQFVAVDA